MLTSLECPTSNWTHRQRIQLLSKRSSFSTGGTQARVGLVGVPVAAAAAAERVAQESVLFLASATILLLKQSST